MADWPAAPAPSKVPLPRTDLRLPSMWAMVQRNRDVYLKTWKTNFLPPLLEPLLYLVALGFGLGALVTEVDGVGYARFIAGAILAITMMQAAFFETTYNSFVRMWFQKTWEAVTATPLSLDDVLVGEVLWAALKSTINAALMAVVVAAFGLLPWWAIVPVAAVGLLTGLVFGGLGLAVSAKVPAIDSFSFAIYLFITPMMLFSGTFFPLDRLGAMQPVALALPLTHAVLLVRPFTGVGELPWTSVAYLLVAAVVAPALAVRMMKRRLAN
jgi:lipooligosaccharide transport system permease protein